MKSWLDQGSGFGYVYRNIDDYPEMKEYLENDGQWGRLRDLQAEQLDKLEFKMISDFDEITVESLKKILRSLNTSLGVNGLMPVYNCLVPFRSSLEYTFLKWLSSQYPKIRNIGYEIDRIEYQYNGQLRYYFPDYSVRTLDGDNTLFEVKPIRYYELEENQYKWKAAERYCKERGFIFAQVSEEDFEEILTPPEEIRSKYYLDLLENDIDKFKELIDKVIV